MRACKLTDYKNCVQVKQTNQGELPIWTKALQKAIDENEYIYIPRGKYYVDDSIILQSNKHIKACRNAEIILLQSCKNYCSAMQTS